VVTYSVIIPAHNESDSLPELLEELVQVMQLLGEPYEILVVDDGSTDETGSVLRKLQRDLRALRVLCLDRNRGQSAALEAGLRAARGEWLITLDADGQNPPKEIARLVEALPGWDAVCGWRRDRQDSAWKRFSSRLANSVRRLVLKDGIHDIGCSLRVFHRACLEGVHLRMFRGLHRFFPALLVLAGYRVHQVPIGHRPRRKGRSHYATWNRLIGPLMDLWAVRWMKRRWPRYECREIARAGADTPSNGAGDEEVDRAPQTVAPPGS
jgi:dolichol-phosphate mannosyltransferase